jgi:hypothetical protein
LYKREAQGLAHSKKGRRLRHKLPSTKASDELAEFPRVRFSVPLLLIFYVRTLRGTKAAFAAISSSRATG